VPSAAYVHIAPDPDTPVLVAREPDAGVAPAPTEPVSVVAEPNEGEPWAERVAVAPIASEGVAWAGASESRDENPLRHEAGNNEAMKPPGLVD
jgi:hypothetical protein